jgi:hypothetical protein
MLQAVASGIEEEEKEEKEYDLGQGEQIWVVFAMTSVHLDICRPTSS